jgi:hypothetical protein
LFGYIETEAEIICMIRRLNQYYDMDKPTLNNGYVQLCLETVHLNMKNHLTCLCHCYFLAATTFGLAGDSIVGATDIVVTTRSVNVCTCITIDGSMNA